MCGTGEKQVLKAGAGGPAHVSVTHFLFNFLKKAIGRHTREVCCSDNAAILDASRRANAAQSRVHMYKYETFH
jgi:hypothetical protein